MDDFYLCMEALERRLGGKRRLKDCNGRQTWPLRGVYFFFEPGESRDSQLSGRVVRVGTHALKPESGTSLWQRLSQHRGNAGNLGGNHRGSIFRLIVGEALLAREGATSPTWGRGATAPSEIRRSELTMEQEVSHFLGQMELLWLSIDDVPGPSSLRGMIERNSIGLLSNYGKPPVNPPTTAWLGRFSNRIRVRESGLWNSNHTEETYDPEFLRLLSQLTR